MFNRKAPSVVYRTVVTLVIVAAFIFDVIFSTSRVPVLTMIVCGIVTLYECISPFIYSSR